MSGLIQITEAKKQGRSVDYDALALDYCLWRDAADKAIEDYWNQYEQSLTVEEREEELPHAAKEFAQDTRRLNEYEAWREHVTQREPQGSPRDKQQLFSEFEKVGQRARSTTIRNTTSFAQRAIEKSGKSDLPGH